jgi:O-acetyl-ADP-ribose deacetylase (regulator of RNase III)
LLASAYRASFRLAREHGVRSIAFPAISTGIYGYPLEAATTIAVAAAGEAVAAPGAIEWVLFACFDEKVLQAYRRAGVTA